MMIIRQIHPASAFKVGFAIHGFFGLILGAFCTLATLAGIEMIRQAHVSFFGVSGSFVGLFAIVLCPILYGIIGGIGAAIGSFIYNIASSWIGGLEIETS